MSEVTVIHLNAFEIECIVCGCPWSYSPAGPSMGLPIYEGDILRDDDPGEWGGAPVCPRCYFVAQGMLQETTPGQRIALRSVRDVTCQREAVRS